MVPDEEGDYTASYLYGIERIMAENVDGLQPDRFDPLYYLYDGLGSACQLVNGDGEVWNKFMYEPFGEPRAASKLLLNRHKEELLHVPFGFTGEAHDFYNGLIYLRARYYDPSVGSFISRDSYLGSLIRPLSQNRYTYVENNPINYIDPSGHNTIFSRVRKYIYNLINNDPKNNIKAQGNNVKECWGSQEKGSDGYLVADGYEEVYVASISAVPYVPGRTTTIDPVEKLKLIIAGYLVYRGKQLADATENFIDTVVDSVKTFIDKISGEDKTDNKAKGTGEATVQVKDLKRLPDSKVKDLGGEGYTQPTKGKTGKSKADLYWNPKTGDVYSIPKSGGTPEYVDTIPIGR